MASREELEAKRAQARKLHRAATNKLSRIKAKEGLSLAGTGKDPRKEPASIKRMNSAQLDAHIARVSNFVSRDTQFRQGARGAVLSGELWQRNQQLQAAINRQREQGFSSVKGMHIPAFGTTTVNGKSVPITVEMNEAQKPAHPVSGNPASRAPHLPVNISSKGIPNDRALRLLNKELQQKLSEQERLYKRDKKVSDKMVRTIAKVNRSPELKEVRTIYKDLTPGQFAFLWNYTKFSEISSFDYEIAKSKLHDPKSLSQYDAAFDTQIREMNKIIKDVKNLNL